ncbi:MAG: protein kinase [Muribaculaceae bacterium]|nr:protein kinase [Muribaculaceae bacterium]
MAYISKEEKKIPINDPSGKWSDLTLLPEWGEEFYDVYTVRKHGKWVMIKSLKKEYADNPVYVRMLEREFDTRYNLNHPNIVMVNDLEMVPGVGMSIVTDDVYGYSLRQLIDEKKITSQILDRLRTQFISALTYIQENHIVHYPITPDTIIFCEDTNNLKLIDVGYDHRSELSVHDTKDDIRCFGEVVGEVLDNLNVSMPRLRRIANSARDPEGPYNTIVDVQLDLQKRSGSRLLTWLCIFIILMLLVLVWLTLRLQ